MVTGSTLLRGVVEFQEARRIFRIFHIDECKTKGAGGCIHLKVRGEAIAFGNIAYI